MSRTSIILDPSDHGRRMSLDEFDHAESGTGQVYELSQGVITVVNVPGPQHLRQVNAIRRQFAAYDLAHPGLIHAIASGGECKIPVADMESERHPDLAIYKTAPPADADVWAGWVPEIVIEVISPGSEQRDYVEKREEYLKFGVIEYWIVDSTKQEVLVLRRSRGQWLEQSVKSGASYQTRLLPEFILETALILATGT